MLISYILGSIVKLSKLSNYQDIPEEKLNFHLLIIDLKNKKCGTSKIFFRLIQKIITSGQLHLD